MAIGCEPVDDVAVGSMIRTVVLFVAALGVADRVEASCVCYTSLAPCASFRDADRVFVGRVLEVKDRVESGTATVRFQVIRNGRGTRVGPLRLVADVARCDAAGGPWIDR
jgi:hypothetical protein